MKPRIYRRHTLNRHFGEQELQERSVIKFHIRCKQCLNDKHVIFRLVVLHLPHASYVYENYWLCDRCEKSAANNDVKTESSFD